MSTDDLTQKLTTIRIEAHRLSQEKLAQNAPDAVRLRRAQQLDAQLTTLQPEIDGSRDTDRARQNDIVRVARRYLIFLLTEAEVPGPATFKDQAQALHNDVVEVAKLVAADKLEGPAREKRVASFATRFEALLADSKRNDAEAKRILGDVNLDLQFIRQGGNVPTSLRLARELRPDAGATLR